MKTATLYITEIKFQFSSFEVDKTNKTDSIPDTSQRVYDTSSYAKDTILNRKLL